MSDTFSWLGPLLQAGAAGYGAYSAGNAARTAANSGNNALGLQAQMYNQNRADLTPWRQTGQAALGQMGGQIMGGFQASPGYQFAQDEGMRTLNNRLAGMGMTNSGMAQREAMRFGTGLANQEYGNYWNRLAGLAGVGQTAAGQTADMGQRYGQNAGNTMMGVGSALASGQTQAASGLMSGANALAGYWLNNTQQPKPPEWGGGGGQPSWGYRGF